MYFHHWREFKQIKGRKLSQDFKNRLVQLHRDNVQQAFNLWKKGRNHKIIMMQMDYNEDIQAGNFEIEEESREIERAI